MLDNDTMEKETMNNGKHTNDIKRHAGFPIWAGCALTLLAGLALLAGSAAAEYYVDSVSGQDDADGLSEAQAWRSLDRVNDATLKPGDTVRFKCGGVWRGTLAPASGDETAPVTYTSYGQGEKPLLLGSVPRNRPEDWVNIKDEIWATLPTEYATGDEALDLRQGDWGRHQEAGANVTMTIERSDAGRTLRFACENSGTASNHVQLWGPALAVKKGAYLSLRFRARSDKPFALPGIALQRNSAPWPVFASANAAGKEIGPEWNDFEVMLTVTGSNEDAHVHINLGGILPAGAVFEFQPIAIHAVTVNIPDPLSVDVGNIIFDQGKICGWKKWSLDDLKNPYDYFYEGASCRVYLCCPGNPATLHTSIECALKRHVINQSNVHYTIYDGLAIKYGAAHGFGGAATHHLIIRNCDLAYIGGGHQLTRPDGNPVRFGNAIEFWGAAHDNLVENNRIWEVYDAALTNQNHGDSIHQEDIVYRDNVIWNCEYSFEYWNSPENSVTKNIHFVNNTCVNAGVVWSHAQRPDPNGSHLMFYSNTATTSNIEIKYNVFCNVTNWGSRYSSGWTVLPDMDYNLWFSDRGVMAYWFKDKLDDFAAYQKTTGLDQHSIFAEPAFVDLAGGDFHLSPESPARTLRSDGGPVGAEALWE